MYDHHPSADGGAERPFLAAEEEEQDRGRPVLATIIGCVAALFIAAAPTGGQAPSGPHAGAALLGWMTAATVLPAGFVWIVAYVATLRKAATAWKVASLIAFLLFAALGAAAEIGRQGLAMRDDAAEVARMMEQIAESEDPLSERVSGGDGPLAKMTAAGLVSILEDSRRFQEEFDAAGVAQILSFEGLTHKSPVLDRCDDVAAIAERAEFYGDRFPVHLAAAEAVGKREVADGRLSDQALRDFMEGALRERANPARHWELQADVARQAGALCTILAARKWQKPAAMVEFHDPAQLAEVNKLLARADEHIKELNAVREAGRKATREELGALR